MDTVENNNVVKAGDKIQVNIEHKANDTTTVTKEDDQSLKDWLKAKYIFLKEEKNLGPITWLTTIFTTIAVAYLKLIRYVSESGKLAYWNLSLSIIDIADDNALYDIIMTVVFAAVIMAFLLIPYFVIKSRMRLPYKIVLNLLLAVCISLVMFFSGNTKEIVMHNGWRGVLAFFITDIMFLCIFFGPSFLFWLSTLPPKRNKAITPKHFFAFVVVFLIFNIVYFYSWSYWSSANQTLYRITNDGYAIIYETDDHYYLAKYNTKDGEIDKSTQKVIDKTDVEYRWINTAP